MTYSMKAHKRTAVVLGLALAAVMTANLSAYLFF